MVDALITPRMISWARERAQLTTFTLAKKMSVSIERINAWEKENSLEHPSIKQAIGLSSKLHIPLGYLYLISPPVENIPIPDLRTISNTRIDKPSPEFIDTLYDAYRKQQWYKEYLENEGATSLEFANQYNISDDPILIANDIQKTMNINDELRKECSNWEQFLTALIRQTEKARILVS